MQELLTDELAMQRRKYYFYIVSTIIGMVNFFFSLTALYHNDMQHAMYWILVAIFFYLMRLGYE